MSQKKKTVYKEAHNTRIAVDDFNSEKEFQRKHRNKTWVFGTKRGEKYVEIQNNEIENKNPALLEREIRERDPFLGTDAATFIKHYPVEDLKQHSPTFREYVIENNDTSVFDWITPENLNSVKTEFLKDLKGSGKFPVDILDEIITSIQRK